MRDEGGRGGSIMVKKSVTYFMGALVCGFIYIRGGGSLRSKDPPLAPGNEINCMRGLLIQLS